jgi:hypothetical protein
MLIVRAVDFFRPIGYDNIMRKRSSKPADVNQLGKSIVDQAVGNVPKVVPVKNQAAVELGRMGGLKGGKARAEKLSAKKRREIAKKAAQARWMKMAESETPIHK